MTEIIEKIGFIALGGIISAVAYLLKRKIESKPDLELLDKHQKVLDVHKKMSEQGLDIQSLNTFGQMLTAKSASVQNHIQGLQTESATYLVSSPSEHVTQLEMNQQALESFTRSSEKMSNIYDELKNKLDSDQIPLYESSQSSWLKYSKEQALAVASMYRGGSIYPLIYHTELETLVHERTARINSELDELIQLGN
ncbi:lysozyme inhibitor LprI family protein [Shewanella sp. 1_MG-2023]|uniref:lysozyme inhibitor LprI family protein n=1 Tax=unclassified Shewanella TaxID=196818 RepID=UPI0026E12221|nr:MULTISPECIES: lysozyme inhibitor LprI family protein [unclassified Shewanella]MDO6612280.1 lysozyme inhibitor LprI family protein [Shewanella sp. 7_MG-2023]MDO6772134.1 lysozyme inhibitor LprI family protein [Shewanella sp. 2_MG-2023]MDO6794040.1 lysozyme inhibitor LprI family protein [Shewanella sp. 1_MG-2023]